MTTQFDDEDRKQQRLRRFGTENPTCVICGESDSAVLDLHHIAGQQHHDDVAIVCANCHRKLSDKQRGHGSPASKIAGQRRTIGQYLLGLADLLMMIAEALRRFGAWLLSGSKSAAV
jgi:hypothetical protein